jgi:hypothetical protein
LPMDEGIPTEPPTTVSDGRGSPTEAPRLPGTVYLCQNSSSKNQLAIPIPDHKKTPTLNVGAREGRPSDFSHGCLLMRADLPMSWPCLTAVE